MESIETNPRLWLESEYLSRKRKNSAYSLRAFASFLEIPSGRLSQLLSEKRRFTPKLGRKIAARMNFDPRQTDQLLKAIELSRPRKSARSGPMEAPKSSYRSIDMDHFQSIADPIHYSILSLLEVDGFDGTAKGIAVSLGVSALEARSAADCLVRLGFIEKVKGRFQLIEAGSRSTSHDVSFPALRQAHKKVLRDAAEMIDEIAVEIRDVTSITMAIDPKKLPQAKERIRDFRRSLSEFLESGKKSEVYRLNIQLMPVTKQKGKKS